MALGAIAYLSILTAIWNSDLRASDLGLWSPVPDAPDVELAELRRAFVAQSAQLEPQQETAILNATLRDAIEDDALFIRALAHLRAGESETAIPLLEAARKRNPRSREARILLLDSYISAGRVDDALAEVSVLSRLMGRARETMVAAVAEMVTEPETREATLAALPGHDLQQSVVQALAGSGTDPRTVLRAIRSFAGEARYDERVAVFADRVMRALVERGEVASARMAWRIFYGLDAASVAQPVYNSGFDDLPGGPPFGWQFVSGAAGLAEHDDGSVSIEYFGREQGEFARQLLVLSPGRYRFQTAAAGDSETPALRWQLSCVGASEPLMERPIGGTGQARNAFTVPPGDCPAQWLILASRPSEFSNPQSVRIDSVAIEGIGE